MGDASEWVNFNGNVPITTNMPPSPFTAPGKVMYQGGLGGPNVINTGVGQYTVNLSEPLHDGYKAEFVPLAAMSRKQLTELGELLLKELDKRDDEGERHERY